MTHYTQKRLAFDEIQSGSLKEVRDALQEEEVS